MPSPAGTIHSKRQEVEKLVSRTWNMLEREAFIEPAPGMNGTNGWRQFTEKGLKVAKGENLQRVREASEFPLSLLHPSIRESSLSAIEVRIRRRRQLW
jgi:hypothetical protein